MAALSRHALAIAAALAGSACSGSIGGSANADAGAGTDGSSGSSGGGDAGCGSGACAPRVIAIAAGGDFTCALLSSGTVECWGDNFYGELGIGTRTGPQTCIVPSEDPDAQTTYPCSTTPVVVLGLSDVTALVAGGTQTSALLSGGTVECWGEGMSADSTTPEAVSGLSGVTAIAAGWDSMCALLLIPAQPKTRGPALVQAGPLACAWKCLLLPPTNAGAASTRWRSSVRDTPELRDFEERLFPQTHIFDRRRYLDTLATFSDHATLPAEQRGRLFNSPARRGRKPRPGRRGPRESAPVRAGPPARSAAPDPRF